MDTQAQLDRLILTKGEITLAETSSVKIREIGFQ